MLKTRQVYALIDPRDNRVRYVGCTTMINGRIYQHVSSHNQGQPAIAAWIEELLDLRLLEDLKWEILETVESRLPCAAELKWIKFYGTRGEADLNQENRPRKAMPLRVPKSKETRELISVNMQKFGKIGRLAIIKNLGLVNLLGQKSQQI